MRCQYPEKWGFLRALDPTTCLAISVLLKRCELLCLLSVCRPSAHQPSPVVTILVLADQLEPNQGEPTPLANRFLQQQGHKIITLGGILVCTTILLRKFTLQTRSRNLILQMGSKCKPCLQMLVVRTHHFDQVGPSLEARSLSPPFEETQPAGMCYQCGMCGYPCLSQICYWS